MNITESASVLR